MPELSLRHDLQLFHVGSTPTIDIEPYKNGALFEIREEIQKGHCLFFVKQGTHPTRRSGIPDCIYGIEFFRVHKLGEIRVLSTYESTRI